MIKGWNKWLTIIYCLEFFDVCSSDEDTFAADYQSFNLRILIGFLQTLCKAWSHMLAVEGKIKLEDNFMFSMI